MFGDGTRPQVYPNYEAMQDLVDHGYASYKQQVRGVAGFSTLRVHGVKAEAFLGVSHTQGSVDQRYTSSSYYGFFQHRVRANC